MPTTIAPVTWARSLSKNQAEEIAQKVIEVTGFIPGEMRVEEVVTALEGTIRYADLTAELAESGSMIVNGPENFIITLSDTSSELRDNFTIAHEIGHYILHSNLGQRTATFTRYGSNQLEWEANWFAAALLMPRDKFTSMSTELNNSSIRLAAHFNVSEIAVDVRKKTLGL